MLRSLINKILFKARSRSAIRSLLAEVEENGQGAWSANEGNLLLEHGLKIAAEEDRKYKEFYDNAMNRLLHEPYVWFELWKSIFVCLLRGVAISLIASPALYMWGAAILIEEKHGREIPSIPPLHGLELLFYTVFLVYLLVSVLRWESPFKVRAKEEAEKRMMAAKQDGEESLW